MKLLRPAQCRTPDRRTFDHPKVRQSTKEDVKAYAEFSPRQMST